MSRHLVIDVSHWDGDIDLGEWVRRRGLWGVIVKFGGNETSLGRYRDSMAEANYAKAVKLGLHVGAYYYTVSTTTQSATDDARHFLSLLEGKRFDLPIYMDVEDRRQFALSKRALTDVIKAFCDHCDAHGYKSGLYTGGNAWLNNMYGREELTRYADWIAWWRGSWPSECGDIGMWQQGGMRLSDGDVVYADKSGYTDVDWCAIDYPAQITKAGLNGYKKDGGASMGELSYNDMAAEVCEHIIDHAAHGYSQPHRMGDGTNETIKLSDGTSVTIHGGDYDCSELMRMCYAAVGVLPKDSYMWTGNEDELLTSNGFTKVPVSSARRGDVLLRSGHTEMHLGNGLQGGARIDEAGGITGPRKGDQTGWEITKSAFTPDRWSACYRCTKQRPTTPKVGQVPESPKNDLGLKYQMHCQTVGWLPVVHDGQTAGTVGFSKRGEALRITPPDGVELEVIAHCQTYGSFWYDGIKKGNDVVIGTTGQSKRLEALRIRVTKRPDKLKGKKLKVQAHLQGSGWQNPVGEDQWAGTIGQSRRLEAIRIWFE